jgi:hypothetical protein
MAGKPRSAAQQEALKRAQQASAAKRRGSNQVKFTESKHKSRDYSAEARSMTDQQLRGSYLKASGSRYIAIAKEMRLRQGGH